MMPFLMLFISSLSRADCDAPDLSFKKHEGLVHQFKITSVLEVSESVKGQKNRFLFPLGDATFLVAPDLHQKQVPKKVEVSKRVSAQILASFKSSPNYLDGVPQKFELGSVQGLDLNGDPEADVVLFEVTPGANVYTGAIFIKGQEFLTLIDPVCY